MPAESLTILCPCPKMDPEMDTDNSDSEELASLLAEASLGGYELEQSNTRPSCPVNLYEDAKEEEHLTDSIVWPPQGPWSQDSDLPPANAIRVIPFQADHSVSLLEESRKSPTSRPSTSRYKTELCRTFQESGICKYGSKCQFAHGTAELRGLSRHPKYKTELCRTYHTTGFCPYGFRCHFIHNIEEQRFNSGNVEQRPPLLRQSISCSGIPSLSSSGSPFSSSQASSLTSLSTFSPTSPMSPTSSSFASVGSSFSTPSPVTVAQPLFGLVSPPRLTVQNPWLGGLEIQPSALGQQGDPKMADNSDSLLQHEGMEESTPVCGNSEETKRLPIFSLLAD